MRKSFFSQPWLVIGILLPILMVLNEVSLPFSLSAIFIIIWKFLAERFQLPKLNTRWTAFLSLLVFAVVLQKFRTFLNQEPALSLLIVLTALKIMDYQTERDHKFVCLLSFIMLALKSLYNLEVFWLPPTLLSFFLVWLSLLDGSLKNKFRYLLSLFATALPVTFGFFFFFPRFVVPWAIQKQTTTNESGFATELGGSQISQMAQSQTPVFRVNFIDGNFVQSDTTYYPHLRQSELYWSGTQLSLSTGLIWKENGFFPLSGLRPTKREKNPDLIRYQVLLEPQDQAYLFGLENLMRIEIEDQAIAEISPHLFKTLPSGKPLSYLASSLPRDEDRMELPAAARESLLQTPPLPTKTQAWVNDLLKQRLSETDRLKALQKFFSTSGFSYTLNPGAYGLKNGLDDFLFTRRLGFCEHFAGAYALLARALGLPALVVVGFQGGEYNPLGQYWLIRQSDAHAWVRVFINDHWLRVDPTTWVAPLRFEMSAREFFSLTDKGKGDLADPLHLGFWQRAAAQLILDRAGYFLDSLNYHYTNFILEFDKEGQREFLKDYGQFILLLLFSSLSLFFLARQGILHWRVRKSKPQRDLEKLLRTLQKQGAERRAPSTPPLRYARDMATRLPELRTKIEKVTAAYEREIYGSHAENREL